jgi:HEAT repeat protein
MVLVILAPSAIGLTWILSDPAPASHPAVVALKRGGPAERIRAVDDMSSAPWASNLLVDAVLNDPDPTVRSSAWKAVRSRWNNHVGNMSYYDDAALEAATWSGPDSESAFRLLTEHVDEAARIRPLLDDPSPEVRQRAAKSLANIAMRTRALREVQSYLNTALEEERDRTTRDVLKLSLDQVSGARAFQQGVRVKGELRSKKKAKE